jgi:hypothetical protein
MLKNIYVTITDKSHLPPERAPQQPHIFLGDTKAIEVLRRQPDGTWKLIFGDPNARDCGKERHENARGAENKQ